jgi:glycine/D-amino acid oxidase-like deaminating enzyme
MAAEEQNPYKVALKEATPYKRRQGQEPTDYDVVVVGAGLVGSSCAFWLARQGAKVLLVEQYAEGLSKGASLGGPRRIGILDLAPGLRVRKAWDMFLEINKEAEEPLLDVSGETLVVNIFPWGWLLMIAFFLWKLFRFLSNHALPAGLELLWMKPQVQRRLPKSIKPTWNNFGVYYPEAAGIYPRRCLDFFQKGAKKAGATCQFNTEVTNVRVVGGKTMVDTGAGTSISCSECVIAAAGWTGILLQRMGHSEVATEIHTFTCPIFPCKLPDLRVETGCPIFAFPMSGIYGFPTNDAFPGRLDIRTSAPGHYGDDPLFKEAGDANLKTIDTFLKTYIPDQSRQSVSCATCHYPRLAIDGENFKPVIDKVPGTDGRVIVLSGFDGYGFKYGPLYGLEALDLLAGKPGPTGLEWKRQEGENVALRSLHKIMDGLLATGGGKKMKPPAAKDPLYINGRGDDLKDPLLSKA